MATDRHPTVTRLLAGLLLVAIGYGSSAQYSDLGKGNLKNSIWWFNWKGLTFGNGATRTFTTDDGLTVQITFSKFSGITLQPTAMKTWVGSMLYRAYDFSDPNMLPALYFLKDQQSYTTRFSVSVTATRNGVPTPVVFVVSDPEASNDSTSSTHRELTTLTTDGSKWETIDFFKNSQQTAHALNGCGTQSVILNNTYSNVPGIGQVPIIATGAGGALKVDVVLDEIGNGGGMGVVFGVLDPIDRGDLPPTYGVALHALRYTGINSCNDAQPYPSLKEYQDLKLGAIPGDPDALQYTDDNAYDTADEDAITSFPHYDGNGTYSITVPLTNNTGKNAYLAGWFDYNRDSVFGTGESASATVPNNSTKAVLSWSGLPAALPPGISPKFAFRFRLSSDKNAAESVTGFASDGEVEDYACGACVVDSIVTCTIAANFSFTQDFCDPAIVHFKDETIGDDKPAWSFGNGVTVNNNPTPDITYNSGTFAVKLLAQANNGCTDTITRNVVIKYTHDKLIANNDTMLCKSSLLQLKVLPASVQYCWSPAEDLSATDIANPVATASKNITYRLNAKTTGTNLIVNGDFSQSNAGFSSAYLYSANGYPEGVYYVGDQVKVWHNGLEACEDHTGGGNRSMMFVNGSSRTNVEVWTETVKVTPNTDYAFSTWLESLSPSSPAQLQFSINGKLAGPVFNADNSTCVWHSFFAMWNSGGNSIATISIVNMNSAANGNDFALDDIFFGEVSQKYDSINIRVDSVMVHASPDTTICVGGTARLVASVSPNATYHWSPSAGLDDTTVLTPVAAPLTTTTYTISAKGNNGCTEAAAIAIVVNPKPAFGIDPAAKKICVGDPLTLTATGGDVYQWLPADAVANPTAASTQANPKTTTTYTVIIGNNACRITDTLTTTITADEKPVATVSKSNDIDCSQPSTNLRAAGGNQYAWTPAETLSAADIANPKASPAVPTTYNVVVTKGGCSVTDSIRVNITNDNAGTSYHVPTAFTPNGDNVNDCFGLRYWGAVRSILFEVYNRWGKRVFYTTDVSKCWDGAFNGVKQPTGTYIYQIKAVTFCGNIYRKGTVVLIR